MRLAIEDAVQRIRLKCSTNDKPLHAACSGLRNEKMEKFMTGEREEREEREMRERRERLRGEGKEKGNTGES